MLSLWMLSVPLDEKDPQQSALCFNEHLLPLTVLALTNWLQHWLKNLYFFPVVQDNDTFKNIDKHVLYIYMLCKLRKMYAHDDVMFI